MKTRFGRQLERLGRVRASGANANAAETGRVGAGSGRSAAGSGSATEPTTVRSEIEARVERIRAQLDSMTARHNRSSSVHVTDGRPEDERLSAPAATHVDGSELAGALLGETIQTSSGRVHRVLKRYRRSHSQGCGPVASALEASPQALASISLDPAVGDVDLRRALFFDTETTGLAGGTGTLPFLVGMAAFEPDKSLKVEQLVLLRPGEERPVLERFAERLAAASCVVSYNGKSFDWPLIRTRYVMNRMTPPELPVHIDLLHCARRVFKSRLEVRGLSVSLAAVEDEVFGMGRVDDVAGGRIPECYAAFLRGAPGAVLNPVIEHNAHDLVSLASLLGDLSMRYLRDPTVVCASDSLGLAKTALRAKDLSAAEGLAQAAAEGTSDVAVEAAKVEARVAQRRGDFERAAWAMHRALALGGVEQPDVHLTLAKLYEHKVKDFERALHHAQQLGEEEERRRVRLKRRLAKAQAMTAKRSECLPMRV